MLDEDPESGSKLFDLVFPLFENTCGNDNTEGTGNELVEGVLGKGISPYQVGPLSSWTNFASHILARISIVLPNPI